MAFVLIGFTKCSCVCLLFIYCRVVPNNILANIDPDTNISLNLSENNSKYLTVNEFKDQFKHNDFTCVCYNVRSFNANSDALLACFDSASMPNVFIFTETWFTPDFTLEIAGYKAYHVYRSVRRSGGVSIYVKNSFSSSKFDNLCMVNDTIETCSISLTINNINYILMGMYRPHSDSQENFTSYLENLLNGSISARTNLIIMGDFNINLIQTSDSVNNFLNSMHSNNFLPLISKPTRLVNQLPHSLIDHIWVNGTIANKFESGIILHDITDHLPIFLKFPIVAPTIISNSKVKVSFRLINSETKTKFKNAIAEFNWQSIENENLHVYTENLIRKINEIFMKCCPLKVKEVPQKRIDSPWLNSRIQDLIRAKSAYYKMFKRGIVSGAENNSFKNRVKAIIRSEKIKYFRNLFNRNRNNIARTWSTIRYLVSNKSSKNNPSKILYDDREVINDHEIAEVFNEYFVNTPLILDDSLPPSEINPLHRVIPNRLSSMFLHAVSPRECFNIIKNLKNTGTSLGSIPTFLLKENAETISPILCKLINKCFSSGIFPDFLKLAIVSPIFKNGDPLNIKNYRPISVLHLIAKIFEKCILIRLLSFIDSSKLLSDSQFGFRRGMSTETALIKFSEKLYNAIDEKNIALNIFIDLKRAFDTVPHNILLRKLELYGIRGRCLAIFKDFLRNRIQCVKINNKLSSHKNQCIGLPQGSALSATLFLLYVNDMPNFSSACSCILYADDTTLCYSDRNLQNLYATANSSLIDFHEWTKASRLSLNPDKTQYMIITNRFAEGHNQDLSLDNHLIDLTSTVKFLGVYVDSDLKFRHHINFIGNKIAKSTGILKILSRFLPIDSLISIYYALIHPYLSYCNLVWGTTPMTNLQPLIVMQKKAIRIICKQNYLAHSSPLFFQCKILKLPDLIRFRQATHVYSNQNLYSSLSHSYSTRNRNHLTQNFHRLRLTQQSHFFRAAEEWNKIPEYIKAANSLHIFKKDLKTYLLQFYR